MAISVLAARTTGGTPTSDDISVSVNVPSGTTAIIVGLSCYRAATDAQDTSIVPDYVKYNSVSATAINGDELWSTNRRYYTGLWRIVNPSTGDNTFEVDFPAESVKTVYTIICLSGVDTADLIGAQQVKTISSDTGVPNDTLTTDEDNTLIALAVQDSKLTDTANLAEISSTTETELYAINLANPYWEGAHGYRGTTGAAGNYDVGWDNDSATANRIILAQAQVNAGDTSTAATKYIHYARLNNR